MRGTVLPNRKRARELEKRRCLNMNTIVLVVKQYILALVDHVGAYGSVGGSRGPGVREGVGGARTGRGGGGGMCGKSGWCTC